MGRFPLPGTTRVPGRSGSDSGRNLCIRHCGEALRRTAKGKKKGKALVWAAVGALGLLAALVATMLSAVNRDQKPTRLEGAVAQASSPRTVRADTKKTAKSEKPGPKSDPKREPDTATTPEKPARKTQREPDSVPTITIVAVIDGTDTVLISSQAATWNHGVHQWPTSVKINTMDWNPRKEKSLKAAGTDALLKHPVDFSSARLRKIRGRGPVKLTPAKNHIAVSFDDTGFGGADTYEVLVTFGPDREADPKLWGHLVTAQAQVMQNFLRLDRGGNELATKESYSGPLEISVVARTERNNIRIHAFQTCRLIFNWEGNPRELRVHRNDGKGGRDSGSLATAPLQPLTPNTWYKLAWRITEEGMVVSVDDKVLFREDRKIDLSVGGPIVVHTHDSAVDVQSVSVKSLK